VVVGLRAPLSPGVQAFPPGLKAPLVGLALLDAHRCIRFIRRLEFVHLVQEVAFPQVGIEVDDHGVFLR